MRSGRAVGRACAFVDMHRALGEADIAIDRGDDLRDRDRVCTAAQTIAAGWASGSRRQAGMSQALQQFRHGCLRQTRRNSDRTGGYLAIGRRREVTAGVVAVTTRLPQATVAKLL